jgi:hypothetical protein
MLGYGRNGVGAIVSMYRRHCDRVFARGNRAGNFEFEDVVRQRNEASAEADGPFSGISNMDPRGWASVPSAEMKVSRRFPRPNRWDQDD